MEQHRQFRGVWIPREIWLNKELTNQEKTILIEIDSLEDEEKGCWASNKHFNEMFGITHNHVSRAIQNLQRKGFIRVEYDYKGKQILCRRIYINRPPYPPRMGYDQNGTRGYDQNGTGGMTKMGEESITYISNTNININIYKYIIDYLNSKIGTKYKSNSKKTVALIKARMNEGFNTDDFITVIDKKVAEWLNTEMENYLRPETLFGNKFEGYLNSKEIRRNKNSYGNANDKMHDILEQMVLEGENNE